MDDDVGRKGGGGDATFGTLLGQSHLIMAAQPSVLFRDRVLLVNDLCMATWLSEGWALSMMRPLLLVKSQWVGEPCTRTTRYAKRIKRGLHYEEEAHE